MKVIPSLVFSAMLLFPILSELAKTDDLAGFPVLHLDFPGKHHAAMQRTISCAVCPNLRCPAPQIDLPKTPFLKTSRPLKASHSLVINLFWVKLSLMT